MTDCLRCIKGYAVLPHHPDCPSLAYEREERAAIMEFDGNVPRWTAETLANAEHR